MGEEDLNQIKKCLRSVLISCPEGTPINKVESDYKSFLGIPLNFQRFGHKNIDSFLRSIPDTARVQGSIVYGVSCAEITHVTKLINNQRKVTSKVKRVQRERQKARLPPTQPSSYHAPPSKYAWGQNRYGPPMYQSFHPMPPPIRYGPPPMRHPPPPGPQRVPPPATHFYQMPPNYPPAPRIDEQMDDLIFSDEEIFELLTKERIPNSPPLTHILSLAFPYIYRGSHITILDLSFPLCNEIATTIALDCEEELEGSPAIIVCKMQEYQNLALLESSPKVETFRNIEYFKKTQAKVVTLKFSELVHILNVNNEHFYQQTTFIIFVDIEPNRMHLLSNMLPSELQYLFLSTCCDSGKNAQGLYKQPQIVIAKDGAHYRDYANNGEKLIDNLARKLAILNTRHPPLPQQPNPLLPASKVSSKPPYNIPEEPFSIGPQPPPYLPQHYAMPNQIPNMPNQIPNMPNQPYNMPNPAQGILPTPNIRQQAHTVVPQPPIIVPPQPNTVLQPLDSNIPKNTTSAVNGAKPSATIENKQFFPALRHLTDSAFKASMNLLIQAGPNKGKTTLLLEFAISKVDVSIDKLQVILTTPGPKSTSALFLRLKHFVASRGNTDIRAFGYSEGSLDKLNAYLIEQKVHILVVDNGHLFSLLSKAPAVVTSHCKMIGCDELYGSHYTKQVPTLVKNFIEKMNNPEIQYVVMTHTIEDELLIHPIFPKPYWHIRQEESSKKREKYTVSFLHQ